MPIPCRLFAQYDIKQKAGKKMEAYTGFASVYDMFMDNIPYEEWCEYIVDLLDTYGVEKESMIADLGCGTGKITELLSKRGYDMIGIDKSEIEKYKISENRFSFSCHHFLSLPV